MKIDMRVFIGGALTIAAAGCSKSDSSAAVDSAAAASSPAPLDTALPYPSVGAAESTATSPGNQPPNSAEPPTESGRRAPARATSPRTSGGEWDSATKPIYTIDESGNVKPIKRD